MCRKEAVVLDPDDQRLHCDQAPRGSRKVIVADRQKYMARFCSLHHQCPDQHPPPPPRLQAKKGVALLYSSIKSNTHDIRQWTCTHT